MLQFLDSLDKKLLLRINNQHTPFWDGVMIFLTERFVWIPLYFIIVLLLVLKFKKKVWLPLFTIILLITACDQFASAFLKPFIGRLRPCHNVYINHLLFLPKGCGGSYGFISSHAANTFGLACFLSLLTNIRWVFYVLYFWAFIVSFSRIYLAAHYPGDVLGGAITGIAFGFIFFYFFKLLFYKIYNLPYKLSNF